MSSTVGFEINTDVTSSPKKGVISGPTKRTDVLQKHSNVEDEMKNGTASLGAVNYLMTLILGG